MQCKQGNWTVCVRYLKHLIIRLHQEAKCFEFILFKFCPHPSRRSSYGGGANFSPPKIYFCIYVLDFFCNYCIDKIWESRLICFNQSIKTIFKFLIFWLVRHAVYMRDWVARVLAYRHGSWLLMVHKIFVFI